MNEDWVYQDSMGFSEEKRRPDGIKNYHLAIEEGVSILFQDGIIIPPVIFRDLTKAGKAAFSIYEGTQHQRLLFLQR